LINLEHENNAMQLQRQLIVFYSGAYSQAFVMGC